MAYEGPERRVYKVSATRNSESHVRPGVCVAVRDRGTGEWASKHFALQRRIVGSIRFFDSGAERDRRPAIGEAMYFADLGPDLLTSSIGAIEPPAREIVGEYAPGD